MAPWLGLLGTFLLCLTLLSKASANNCVNNTGFEGEYVLCVGYPAAVKVGRNVSFDMQILRRDGEPVDKDFVVNINVTLEHGWLASLDDDDNASSIIVELGEGLNSTVTLYSRAAGRSQITFSTSEGNFTLDYMKKVEREISFFRSVPLNVIIIIVGWIYFLAWSISFYPQIFLNFYRRSVVGLNFDFLSLNIIGFLAYTVFNIGLFWIPLIQQEYFSRHPSGVNPVLLNDVIFSIHAVLATVFTIFQCFIFKRGGQRVSITAMILLVLFCLVLVVSLFVSVGGKLHWLDFLYVASYVKLAITLIKYVPQAWLNFKRRSTAGWSIGNVLLDFTGGSFSILQMFLLSYNYDDWNSIFGDPTKFGLGFFSILFDLLFMFQHYVLFRNATDPDTSNTGYRKIGTADEDKKKNEVNDGDKASCESLSDEERPLLRSDPKKKGKIKKLLGAFKFKK